jgi:heme-degrading monooxygenase HmoA
MPSIPGLVFARAMPFIGSLPSGGFGAGVPAAGAQVLLTAWHSESHHDGFLGSPLHTHLQAHSRNSGWLSNEIASTRGTHLRRSPLAGTGCEEGLFGALTLGRTNWRRLGAFIAEGSRLGRYTSAAAGQICAFSAGIPLTGNCTVSFWRSESDMQRFAYGDSQGHGKTLQRRPAILVEQLNARMRLRTIGGTWDNALPHIGELLGSARGS